MKRYFIEEAKCGVTDGGMACGPVSGNVVVTVRFRESGDNAGAAQPQWISLVEAEGFPNIYLSDRDIYEDLLKEDIEDEAFTEYLQAHYMDSFGGLELGIEYEEIFESIAEDPENPAAALLRYLIALARCDWDSVGPLIKAAEGKYADELEIPAIDIEEEMDEE